MKQVVRSSVALLAGATVVVGSIALTVAAPAVADSGCAPLEPEAGREVIRVTEAADGSQPGTLRWAVGEANARPGLDVIELDPGLVAQVDDRIDITDGVVIRTKAGGDRAEIVGNQSSGPALSVGVAWGDPVFPVGLSDLNFAGSGEDNTAVSMGRGVCELTVSRTTFSGFYRHALAVDAPGTLRELEVSDTVFTGIRGGSGKGAGAMLINTGYSSGGNTHYVIRDSAFTHNSAPGISIENFARSNEQDDSSVLIDRVEFRGNSTESEDAGAINVWHLERYSNGPEFESALPLVVIRDSVIADNYGGLAGGMRVRELSAKSGGKDVPAEFVSVQRSTFTGNSVNPAEAQYGTQATDVKVDGTSVSIDEQHNTAVGLHDSTLDGTVGSSTPNIVAERLDSDIVLDHVTLLGGGISAASNSWWSGGPAAVRISNSVLNTGNVDPVRLVATDQPVALEDQNSAFTTEPLLAPIAGAGRVVTDAGAIALGDLVSDLGPTPVRVPEDQSVLIDAANADGAASDQRGVSRPQGNAPDIGSVEVLPAAIIEQDATLWVGPDGRANAGDEIVFTVERVNAEVDPWTGEASVRVATVDGTAKAGTDYVAYSESLAWGKDDVAPKTVHVQTNKPAGVTEASEKSFRLVLSEPSEHAALGTRAEAAGTIVVTAVKPPVVPPVEPPTTPGKPDPLPNTGQEASYAAWIAFGAVALLGSGVLLLARSRRQNG